MCVSDCDSNHKLYCILVVITQNVFLNYMTSNETKNQEQSYVQSEFYSCSYWSHFVRNAAKEQKVYLFTVQPTN